MKESVNIRYAHVISVLVALVLPLIGALIHLKDGFISTRNPTLICIGRNTDYIYYMLVLPLSFIIGTAAYLLMYSAWILFKVSYDMQ